MSLFRTKRPYSRGLRSSEAGETILSVLVTATLGAFVLAAAVSSFAETSRRSYDNQLISRTENEALAVLDMMAFDLRIMGAGMPLGQAAFQAGAAGLGDAPLPLLPATATATAITFRRNETGRSTALSLDYNPASGLTLPVLSGADFEDGDTVYVSDIAVGGRNGLRGTVSSAGGTSVTIGGDFVASPGATFRAGSTVERVTTVTYTSPADGSGITRDAELGPIVLTPNSTFSLVYFDRAGLPLVLPLTEAIVRDQLASVLVTVTVTSNQPLRTGTFYMAQKAQRVALRNLNFSR